MSFLSRLCLIFFLIISSHSVCFAKLDKLTVEAMEPISEPGRLHIIFSKDKQKQPREYSAWPTANIEPLFSVDLNSIESSVSLLDDSSVIGFPHASLSDIPKGTYRVQAVYDTNTIESTMNSSGNWYSQVVEVTIGEAKSGVVKLVLSSQIEDSKQPEGDELLQFVKFKSDTLSEYWQQDMFLNAGIILPNTYFDSPLQRFPVYFDIGGYASRYTRAKRLYNNPSFKKYWMKDDTPQMIIVFLDGEAPFGDPYQINSANNGPYGDATWNELLPYLTNKYNMIDTSHGRFVSGCSTGGWVSLALQVFYPDLFNGAWSFSADGVDFRYFQLVDIYSDENAFFNEHGIERPSFRQTDGDVIFSIKREIDMENTMGRTNSYVTSGGQWGGWNAVYSPKGEDGLPKPIWDPTTGKIDKEVAEAWKAYDLRIHTEKNWQELEPKLRGKLNIWMGDMDNFYLNNAMVLFEDMLMKQEPISDAKFTWKRNTGHCDFNSVNMRKQTMKAMMDRFNHTAK